MVEHFGGISSFFWGYVITQVPAGQLAQRCGAKVLLLWSMILCSLLTMSTPWCASYGGWKVYIGYECFNAILHHKCILFCVAGMPVAISGGSMPRRDIPIYTYVAVQMGTGIRTSSVGYLLLFGLAVWHSHYVVFEWLFGVIVHGLAEYILYFWLCERFVGRSLVILRKQFTSRLQVYLSRGERIHSSFVGLWWGR